jgi:hypothetical protein
MPMILFISMKRLVLLMLPFALSLRLVLPVEAVGFVSIELLRSR